MVWKSQRARIGIWRQAIRRVQADYVTAHGKPLNLVAPRRFTEKMQWRKLFDRNPLLGLLCDKLAAREYMRSRMPDAPIVPVLWSGAPADIPFADLVPPYVIKSTHASAQVIIVRPGEPFDPVAMRACTGEWLSWCYGVRYEEPGYAAVPRQLVIEPLLTGAAGEAPGEIRLFAFGGRVAFVNTLLLEDGRLRHGAFHTPEWVRLPWRFSRVVSQDFPPPRRLADMIGIAERLAGGFDHLRVDFYESGDRIWVGELTPYAWSGHAHFEPDEADLIMGDAWKLKRPALRAALAVLLTRRWPFPPQPGF